MANGVIIPPTSKPFTAVTMTSDWGTVSENLTQLKDGIAIVELAINVGAVDIPANAVLAYMDRIIPPNAGKILSKAVNGNVVGYAYTVQNTNNLYTSTAIPANSSVIVWGVAVLQ